MSSTLRPRNIQDDRVNILEIGAETLVYDERTHKAWCLNRSSACIWRLCDGEQTVTQIAAKATVELGAEVGEDLVLFAMDELGRKNLLETESIGGMAEGISRRQMMSRAGLAAAALLPVIAALTAPPAAAQSGSVGTGQLQTKRLERIFAASGSRNRRTFK
jgi:Coenzyme PQQ synthesis protein D (PqqD)